MRARRTRTPPVAGRYTLVERIGRGGTGSVWTAWDHRARRLVAAKLLEADRHDVALLLRFVQEQAVRIRHRHVLAPIGWAAEDDLVLLVTDLVRGGSLGELLGEHGPFPEPLAVLFLDQLLQGLAAVHTQGVVHGDVKPANLLLEASPGRPHLRIADFGVATRAADPVRFLPDGPVGTPGYLAPEQAAGAAPHPSQDVYAAGVVGRRMLAEPGPVTTLLDSMTRPDADRRPAAAAALERLRTLPIRPGGPWPSVPDRLSGRLAPRRAAGGVRAPS